MIVIVSADPQVTHIVTEWIITLDPSVWFLAGNIIRNVVSVQKTASQETMETEDNAGMAILIFDKFQSKITQKWFIQKDDTTYALNSDYFLKQTLRSV